MSKVGVMPLFSTWVYLCENGPSHLNERLEGLARRLMQDDRNSTRRTNCGGWHYAFDFFKLEETIVAEFRNQMEQHVQALLNHFRPPERKKKDREKRKAAARDKTLWTWADEYLKAKKSLRPRSIEEYRRSIDRHLDGDGLRIGGGRVDEALHTRLETVVRVVHEDVARLDRGKDIGAPSLQAIAGDSR